jgi:hypothetical protein
LPNLRDSIGVPGVFFAGYSVKDTNNSVNIKKKIKTVSGHAYWGQEKLFDEKNRRQKSHDAVPLNLLSVNNYW